MIISKDVSQGVRILSENRASRPEGVQAYGERKRGAIANEYKRDGRKTKFFNLKKREKGIKKEVGFPYPFSFAVAPKGVSPYEPLFIAFQNPLYERYPTRLATSASVKLSSVLSRSLAASILYLASSFPKVLPV